MQLEAKRIDYRNFLSRCPSFKSYRARQPHAVEFILLGTPFLLSAPSVTVAVTTDAKRNQVVHHVITKPAPGVHMMDLQALHGTTLLTPPTISLQDLDSEFRALFQAQFESGLLLT